MTNSPLRKRVFLQEVISKIFSELASLNAKTIKEFVPVVSAGAIIFSYIYTQSYYSEFSISLMQIDLDTIDILAVGLMKIIGTPTLILQLCAISALVSFLWALKVVLPVYFRFLYAIALFASTGIMFSYSASYFGSQDSQKLISGGEGRIPYCEFKEGVDGITNDFKQVLDYLTDASMLRYVALANGNYYFSIVSPVSESDQNSLQQGYKGGQIYVVPESSVRNCRIVSPIRVLIDS